MKSQLASVRATLNAVENGSVTAVTRDRLPFNHLGQKRLESKIHADATPEDLRKELQDREMQIERLSSGLALLELKLQDALQNKRNDTAPQDSNMDKVTPDTFLSYFRALLSLVYLYYASVIVSLFPGLAFLYVGDLSPSLSPSLSLFSLPF